MTTAENSKYIRRRWKEVVADLASQRGINPDSLFKKVPAFSEEHSETDDALSIDFKDMTRDEIKILKSAADIMADVIFSILPGPAPGMAGH